MYKDEQNLKIIEASAFHSVPSILYQSQSGKAVINSNQQGGAHQETTRV